MPERRPSPFSREHSPEKNKSAKSALDNIPSRDRKEMLRGAEGLKPPSVNQDIDAEVFKQYLEQREAAESRNLNHAQYIDSSELRPYQVEAVRPEVESFVEYLDAMPVSDPDQGKNMSAEFAGYIDPEELKELRLQENVEIEEQIKEALEEEKRLEQQIERAIAAEQGLVSDDEETSGESKNTMYIEDWRSVEKGLEYQGKNVLPADFKLISRFREGGRSTVFDLETNKARSKREIIVIDAENDPMLQSYITEAREAVENCKDCTVRQKIQKVTDLILTSLKREGSVQRSHELPEGQDVLLGDILQQDAAVCRHRSFLFKTIMDRMPEDIQQHAKTAVVRGGVKDPITGRIGGHAWNTLQIDKHIYLVDLMNPPRHLLEQGSDHNLFPFPEITHAPETGYYFFSKNKNGSDYIYQGGELVDGVWHQAGQFLGHPDILREMKDYGVEEAYADKEFSKYHFLEKHDSIRQSAGSPEYTLALEFIESIRDSYEYLSESDIEGIFPQFVEDSLWGKMAGSKEMVKYLVHGSLNKARALFNEMKDNDGRIVVYGEMKGDQFKAHDYTSYVKIQVIESEMKKPYGPESVPVRVASLT